MLTIMIFVGLLTVLGAGCYSLIRWVLMESWNDWKRSRKELQEDHLREQKKAWRCAMRPWIAS